jgi:cystine transport system substrate-binding protein
MHRGGTGRCRNSAGRDSIQKYEEVSIMKMKKLAAVVFSAAVSAALLAGCGSASGTAETEDVSAAVTSSQASEASSAETASEAASEVSESSAASEDAGAIVTEEPDANGDHLARILAAGKITVATEGAWSPFTYHDADTNELVGFDVEVAKEIASRLGVEAEFEEGDFDGGLTGVSTGTYDMMANGVDITEDREQTFDFTDPYAYDHAVVVTKADNDTIKSFDDLKGLTTANSVGSTYAQMGEEYGATVVNVPTLGETMELVINGTADATINANTSVQDYFNTTGTTELKVAAVDEETTEYAIPLKKGEDNDTLREAINKAIAAMKADGTLTELSNKYFGADITQE